MHKASKGLNDDISYSRDVQDKDFNDNKHPKGSMMIYTLKGCTIQEQGLTRDQRTIKD